MKKRIILCSIPALAAAAVLCAAAFLYWPPTPRGAEIQITVRHGMSLRQAANELERLGVVRNARAFRLTARLFGLERKLRVGRFVVRQGSSPYRAVHDLLSSPPLFVDLTLPEGYDSRRYAGIIARRLELDSLRLVQLVHDADFINRLGIEAPSLEGFIYPETYRLTYGLSEEQVLQAAVQQFKVNIMEPYFEEAQRSPLGFYGTLILASIIEGEAMVDDEMPIIASVYHNRLRIGMRLQADPTIQYLLPEGPRRLLRRDLEIDSPYNTYRYAGLPPTPINNPRRAAFLAALRPEVTDYLYFVAVGNGRHRFSKTYGEHLRAKGAFDLVRRQVERERRKQR